METDVYIAHRYAQAFLNIFSLESADMSHIQSAIEFFNAHPSLMGMVSLSLIPSSAKIALLNKALLEHFKLPHMFKKLLIILIEKKRTRLIIPILKQIQEIYQRRNNVEVFTISSACPLTQEQQRTLQNFLSLKTEHVILSTVHIDPSLIAGIRMESADHLWEYSIAQQLHQLAQRLVD